MKKIVITGALGHIGSRLIREISRNVATHLVLIDNLHSQRYPSLFDLPSDITYEFHQQDIRTADIEPLIEGADALIHLAAITDATSSFGNEKEVEAVNFDGLKRVAEACLKKNVALFFPSSTSVYGSQAERVDETCTELQPQSPYADSKIKAEEFLKGMKAKGLTFITCRFGTIFGWSVGMRFHTAVNKFTWQAINGIPLTVWKTAWEQKRPYLDLGDCINAINFILEKKIFTGEIYNVVTKNFTVKDIVETIEKHVGKVKVDYVDSKIMNQLSYEVDDTKLRSLGYTPKGDIDVAIKQTVEKLSKIKK